MCNKIKCARQYTVDIINNNITGMCKKNVQTGCTGYVHMAAMRMMRIMNVLQFIKLSLVNVIRPSLSLGA